MTTDMPPTEWPVFAFENSEIVYDNPDLLHDDYKKLQDHMRVSGEKAVPLWVFRSLCESYARLMQRVSRGSDGENLSAENADLKETRVDKILKIEENDLMTYGVTAIPEWKETVSQDSAVQEHSDPSTGSSHINTDSPSPRYPSTEKVDAYEVLMRDITFTSMDLSNAPAIHRMAQRLISSNKWARSSSQASDHILYLRWQKKNNQQKRQKRQKQQIQKGTASVCIGFTKPELASRAVMDGIRWAGKYYRCAPYASGTEQKYCTKYLEYGHGRSGCRKPERCFKCGFQHWGNYCHRLDKNCPTCGGAHYPGSPKCPRFVIEMKAGFWPLRKNVWRTLIAGDKMDISKPKPSTTSQLQAQSNIQQLPGAPLSSTVFSVGTENLPDPLDPRKVIEHLDRLMALVIAGGPTKISEEPAQKKRKALTPVHHISVDSPREAPKRLKREEDITKQEEEEAALAL